MRCRYCHVELSPSGADGEFCCDAHREFFEAQASQTEGQDRVSAAVEILRRTLPPLDSTAPATPIDDQPSDSETGSNAAIDSESLAEDSTDRLAAFRDSQSNSGIWRRWNLAWKKAPRSLKLVGSFGSALVIALIAGAIAEVPPPIHQIAPDGLNQVQGQVQQVVQEHWKNLNQTISDRAAIAYEDDFRSGLDAWESRSNLTRTWSYDAAGFVRPGPLAVFKPTLDMSDYRFAFLGEIDQRAMGCVFRAEDLNNYYALRFMVVRPGPLPLVHMIRYTVINGKESSRVEKPLPLTVRPDMLYRVEVNVHGGDFTIMAQGQIVDFWSDNRLQHGGVGFFCNRGERARLHWVEVSHQYDALGRLCAYLAPYGVEGRNGSD